MTRSISLSALFGHLLLILLSAVSVFPVYWMLVTSVKPANEIFTVSLVPETVTLEHYAFVLNNIPVQQMLLNTVLMSALQTILELLTGVLAAYAFARWTFRGSNLLFALIVGTWLIPLQVTMIPNYVLVARLGWLDTMMGLVAPRIAAAFAIVLLRQHIKSFPTELIDAARIDGASSWRILWAVIVPNLRAPLAALGILLFINTWNEYFWPLLVTRKIEHSVIQVGLQMFLTQEGDHWGPLMAGATLASLPIFLIYIVLQRQVIDAFIRSGLK